MLSMLDTPPGALAVHTFGQGPVGYVALHGFTLGGKSWASVAAHLPAAVCAPDLPGHGRTEIAPITLDSTLAAVMALIASLPTPPVLVGYSQGGRIAAQFAHRYPDLLAALVVVSATSGLSEPERHDRLRADEATAARLVSDGIEPFLDAWLAAPLTSTAGFAAAEADRQLRSANTATGLAAALRGLGQGALQRIEPAELRVPTLWVAGSDDHAYTALVQGEAVSAGGTYESIENCGHNVVLERPRRLAKVIRRWSDAELSGRRP